ncbi:MAG: PorT family protein [Tannerella sp.]|jgi:opacity protein-like surface antigen|nr:PorT family protein [Tannerella sp.]
MSKKNAFLIYLLLLSTLHVCAQKKFFVTPKIGLNLSTITNVDSDWKSGLNIGCGVEWLPFSKIGFESGLYYANLGADNVTLENSNTSATVKAGYLQLPLVVKYYAYKGLHAFAGPQAGYKISSSEKPVSILNYGKDFDFSGIIGLGYQFNFGLVLSANYVAGFTSNDQGFYSTVAHESRNCRNSAFQFNLGWRF